MEISIKTLFDLKFGWITNKGDIVVCAMYDHFSKEVLKLANESIKDFDSWYESEYESVKATEQSCQNLIEQGEHPEWHCYEIANDHFHFECLTKLYNAGWIRFGSYDNTNYELEGFKFAFTNQADKIQTFKEDAIENNIHLTITIRKK
jgi:hypothetical protein